MKLLRPLMRRRGSRGVSTWSPLATAFNTRPRSSLGFNVMRERTGLFGRPELTSFEGFYTMKENSIRTTDLLIEEATSGRPSRPLVEIFDELSDTLCKVADLAEFVRIAHPQSQFASAAEDACISVSGVVEKLNTHRPLYEALRESVRRGDSGDAHLAELFLFDFEQSGIQLEPAPRARVVALNDTILQTGQRFMAGAGSPRRVPREAVPPNVRHFFSTDGEQLTVSGLYAEWEEPAAREAAYRAFLAPEPAQDAMLTRLLDARLEMAQLCGFPCYADRAIKASVMETAPNVRRFLDTLAERLCGRAERDFARMRDMKRRHAPHAPALACWDTAHLAHRARAELADAAGGDFSAYFSLGGCMEGVNMLVQALYGITLRHEDMRPGESWAADVYKLAVVHESEGLLGHIYCDFYERPSKPHQDCHFTIQGGKELPDGTYQNPIVVVMLSLSGGHWSGPALLPPSSVDNLFHEMGHALHSMLGRARHQHVSGTRCSTDLAEVPSVLMEYFTQSPQVLRQFAKHFQTQEPMPEDMIQRLCASKNLFGASEMQLQVFYSALDQHYHGRNASFGGRTTEVLKEVQQQYYGLPYVENTAWQHRFSHLVGYGAKYYAYLISRAVAWSAWRAHFAAAPLSRAAGERLRAGVLAHGGAAAPRALLAAYLGADVTPESLAAALADELDHQRDAAERCERVGRA